MDVVGSGINKYLIREFIIKTSFQNASFSVLDFIFFSAVPMLKLNIVSNSVKMHQLAFLLSTFSQQFKLPKTSFQLASECTIKRLYFHFFLSTVPTSKTSF